jgi:hypothetical protein
MNSKLRKSWATKSVAIGFIALTLLGNYWIVLVITGQKTPQWFHDTIVFTSLWVLLSGVGLLITSFFIKNDDTPASPDVENLEE